MAKSTRRGTGQRISRSKKPLRQFSKRPGYSIPGLTTSRRQDRTTPHAVHARRSNRRIPAKTISRGPTESPHPKRNRLPRKLNDRRNNLRPKRSTALRLPTTLLPLRRPNENASRNKTKNFLCTRTAKTRRAIIIRSGFGGINGYLKYKLHGELCK